MSWDTPSPSRIGAPAGRAIRTAATCALLIVSLNLNPNLTLTLTLTPTRSRHGIAAPTKEGDLHVGPTWAFDFGSMTFLTPTCAVDDPTLTNCIARSPAAGETPPMFVYKRSPMWGGGVGDQPGQQTRTLP